MRVITNILICDIDFDRKLPVNRKTFELALHLEKGGTHPPIHVRCKGNGRYELKEGRHRVLAHKLVGRDEIKSYIGIPEEPNSEKPLVTNGTGTLPQIDPTPLLLDNTHEE